jgi:TrmH family RNA methyltransferase
MLAVMPRRDPARARPAGALANLRIVLVRPRGAANVGSTARAMMNCGVADLVLVRPRFRSLAAAERMAVHARPLLQRARVVDDLAAAVADCRLVVGTSARRGGYRSAAAELESAAPDLAAAVQRGRVAVVFGPEDHGLANDDLRHCQRLICIDTDPDYASLNLAQAVLLVCHALRRRAISGAVASDDAHEAAAPAAALDGLYQHLQAALLRIGFLNPQNPEHVMFALRGLLGRAAPTAHEVQVLRGIARQIDWAAGNERAPSASEPAPAKATATRHRSLVTGHRSRRR